MLAAEGQTPFAIRTIAFPSGSRSVYRKSMTSQALRTLLLRRAAWANEDVLVNVLGVVWAKSVWTTIIVHCASLWMAFGPRYLRSHSTSITLLSFDL